MLHRLLVHRSDMVGRMIVLSVQPRANMHKSRRRNASNDCGEQADLSGHRDAVKWRHSAYEASRSSLMSTRSALPFGFASAPFRGSNCNPDGKRSIRKQVQPSVRSFW